MCYQTFSVKTIIHTVYWPNNNEVVKFMWSTHENISQSQWQQQQQQRAEISSQPDVNKETTSKSAQNIKQPASAAASASASAFKTPVAMPRAQKLTEERRCDITNSHFAY